MQREKMTIRKWYGRSVPIPTLNSYGFHIFVAGCIGIVRSVFEDEVGKKIRVRFVSGGTASADVANCMINLNEEYLQGNIVKGKKPLNGDDTISCILGILVHEAAHFAYSPKTLVPAADYIEGRTKSFFVRDLAMSLFNIVEDIFIEAEVNRVVPSLAWMLDCTNEVFFDEEDRIDREKKAEGIYDTPKDYDEIAAAADLLILAKTRETVKATPYLTRLFELARTAQDLNVLEQRFALTLQLYDELVKNMRKGPDVSQRELFKQILIDVRGLTAEHVTKRDMDIMDDGGSIQAKRLKRTLDSTEQCRMRLIEDGSNGLIPVNLFIENPVLPWKPIGMDARYVRLAELARQHAVVNRPYGQDRNRGHSIRKLYRIATDQKIFADPLLINSRAPMDVILLVDCSGSMRNHSVIPGKDRIEAALSAALGAAHGLMEARCGVAVYGHTADAIVQSDVLIHCFKTFNESAIGLDAKMGRVALLAPGIHMSSNRDGYALRYVANKFQSATKRRMIIVFSDGLPAAEGYNKPFGIEHSKKMADEVRQMGIEVLSISIDKDAKDSNNFIYGEENNIFNTDPNVVEGIVKSLILK